MKTIMILFKLDKYEVYYYVTGHVKGHEKNYDARCI